MRRKFLALPLLVFLLFLEQSIAQTDPEHIVVNVGTQGTPLPHFWEQMFGSGRANLSLREGYRNDLRSVKKITDFQYVRFHAIFHDENGVYDEDAQGNSIYNWSYVDQIYDGLLENGVRPFVEISFMPKKLASKLDYHAFWYKQITAPPKDYAKWDALVTAFAKHLIDRYGPEEISKWYFEVWNEPNLDFWTGHPEQATYFELYDHTARALKAVSSRIRVGGPATAQAAWVDVMIDHAVKNNVPLDFVSTHAYGNDPAKPVFGEERTIAPHQLVCQAVDKVHTQIKASARPEMPLIWSEFNATYLNEPQITDSIYMGPWLADTIRQCDGKVDMMSYWAFSDVFEEQGVIKTPFYGGYGLIAEDNIPKAAFRAFALLHKLGETLLTTSEKDVLVTRRKDGTLVLATWNLVEPGASGQEKNITFELKGLKGRGQASIWRVDAQHGDTLAAWKKMGEPRFPTREQISDLKRASEIGSAETKAIHGSQLTLTVPPMGLVVIEVR